jgi:hypothetical protein
LNDIILIEFLLPKGQEGGFREFFALNKILRIYKVSDLIPTSLFSSTMPDSPSISDQKRVSSAPSIVMESLAKNARGRLHDSSPRRKRRTLITAFL